MQYTYILSEGEGAATGSEPCQRTGEGGRPQDLPGILGTCLYVYCPGTLGICFYVYCPGILGTCLYVKGPGLDFRIHNNFILKTTQNIKYVINSIY